MSKSISIMASLGSPYWGSFAIACFVLNCLFPILAVAQNTPPVIQINAGLTLAEGSSAAIGSDILLVTDAEQGATELTFTVLTEPAHGMLSSTTFTQEDVNNNLVSYTHNGGETTMDNFTFSVSDGAGGSIPLTTFIFTVTPVNDAPVLAVNNGLMLNEGTTAMIGVSKLQVTDVDDSPAGLTYTLTAIPSHGELRLSGNPLSVASTFTQANINLGLLSYSHNGGETTSDNFIFSFSDNKITITGNVFNIAITPVNDAPVLAVNNALTLEQGATSTIGAGTLQVTDADDSPAGLTYTLTAIPAHGELRLSGNPLSVASTFTQANVNADLLAYSHSGNDTISDTFVFTFDDGEYFITDNVFSITVTPASTGIYDPSSVKGIHISVQPNPFNPATTIVYTVEKAGPVTVAVYDAVGKLIDILVDKQYRNAGVYRIQYGSGMASGVYFVRLKILGQVRNTKLVLLK